MKGSILVLALGLALAGCHRSDKQSATAEPSRAPQAGTGSSTPAGAGSSTTPANLGNPSSAERKEGANPTQGQVDPKHADQNKDFQQRGDGAGPQSSDTQPTIKN